MPITPDRLCPCHGEPMYYEANAQRHQCVVKRRARSLAYQATPKGRAAKDRAIWHADRRRVRIGQRYVGMAKSAEEAERLNGHIRKRVREFSQEQRCR